MDVSKELIRSIVEKVLAESAGTAAPAEPYKEKDPSGIIKITTDKVETERFEQDGVYLKDVVTLEEAPAPAAPAGTDRQASENPTHLHFLLYNSRQIPENTVRSRLPQNPSSILQNNSGSMPDS